MILSMAIHCFPRSRQGIRPQVHILSGDTTELAYMMTQCSKRWYDHHMHRVIIPLLDGVRFPNSENTLVTYDVRYNARYKWSPISQDLGIFDLQLIGNYNSNLLYQGLLQSCLI